MATTTLAAASTRNGVRHVECAAIQSPAGTPATAASENDVATMPVAVRPPGERNEIGDDREHEAADDATEGAGDDPRGEQQRVVGREAAQRGRHDESGVEGEQHPLVVEAIDPEGGDEPARRRGERIGRNEKAELARPDGEDPHQLRTERHDDHEVDDVRELHGGEREQHRQFARQGPSRARRRFRGAGMAQAWIVSGQGRSRAKRPARRQAVA